jgi:ketosteroid isomerase-like protein
MIAISYRREDSTPVAGRLHDRLRAEFGKENVFMDFDSIPYGVDFREHIKRTLERADVVVAVVGPGWLGVQKEASRRIDDPSDFVRLEIAGALQRGIPVIPILVDDTPMPKSDMLPPDMQTFAFRNALILDTGIDFHHHADRLVTGIRQLLENAAAKTAITPSERKATEAVERTEAPPPNTKPKDQVSPEASAPTAIERPKFKRKQNQMAIAAGGLVLVATICFWIVMFERNRSNRKASSTSPVSEMTPAASRTPAETAAPIVAAVTPPSPSPVITVAQSTAAPAAIETVSANSVANSPSSMWTPSSSSVPEPVYATTPFVSSVDDTEAVRQFVRDYYAALSRHDLDSVVSTYADNVDYQGQGHHDRRYIRKDTRNYFQRWDRIYFDVGYIDASHTHDGDFEVKFNFPFAVGQGYSADKRGVSSQVWILRRNSQGNLRIISQREKVLPARSQPRRHGY